MQDKDVAQTEAQPTQWWAVITLAVATLIVASELSISAFGLPLIAEEFGVSSKATAWVILAYALPLAALALSAGRWVDNADIRVVFMASLVFVGLASIAMAPLGGYVATHFGWREVFLIKLPLLALVLWMGYHTIPRRPSLIAWRQRLPLPGWSMLRETVLIGSAVTCALLAIEQLEMDRWIGSALAVAAVVSAWVWTRLSTSQPVVMLIRRRAFGLPVLALMLMASMMGLVVFLLPFFIADVMQRSPEILGVAMMGFVVTASLIAPLAGSLADRYGAGRVSVAGAVIMAAGIFSMLSIDESASSWSLLWRMAWIGSGMAIFNSPNLTAILRAAPSEQSGAAGGISTVARTAGNALGPAVAAMAWSLGGAGLAGFRSGVLALVVLTLIGLLALIAALPAHRN